MAAAVIAAASVSVASANAQDAVEHFGGNDGTTTVPAQSFRGFPTFDTNGFAQFGYVFPGGGVSGLAPLNLPNGSEITQLCFVGYDDSFHGNATLELVGWEYPRVGTTATTPAQVLATAATGLGPTPGMSTFCAPLAAPIVIKSFGDLNANGVPGWTGYALRGTLLYLPGGGVEAPLVGSVSFGSAVVVWRRAVSPAPAVARFTDVPTTHPQFRYVEALVASGITGGCAADRFCPDGGITRGQFAVFLAVALGLHFPN
jgi:hypothetical protein